MYVFDGFVPQQEGKPAKNLGVAYYKKPVGITDDKGKINVLRGYNGFQNISTFFKVKENFDKVDFTLYSSSLNFEVK